MIDLKRLRELHGKTKIVNGLGSAYIYTPCGHDKDSFSVSWDGWNWYIESHNAMPELLDLVEKYRGALEKIAKPEGMTITKSCDCELQEFWHRVAYTRLNLAEEALK